MKLNFEEKGEGPAVILVHGWGGSSESLKKLAEIIADKGFKTIRIDLPGFGKTPAPENKMCMDDYVELISGAINSLNLHKPVYVGHSFGGKLGMFLAAKYPDLLSKLVLINSSGIKPVRTLKHKITYVLAKIGGIISWIPPFIVLRPIVKFIYYKFIVREMDYYKAGKLKETFKNIINEHVDEKLFKIKTDTLVIWGMKDTFTPLWNGEKIAKNIKNSRLELVDNVGHGLPLFYPQVVADLIINFLK